MRGDDVVRGVVMGDVDREVAVGSRCERRVGFAMRSVYGCRVARV